MVDFAGLVEVPTLRDRTYLTTAPRFEYRRGDLALHALAIPTLGGPRSAGGATPPTPPLNTYAGRLNPESSLGFDWFEHVHILPRIKQASGVVVSALTIPFEVFNAYRSSVTLTSVLNTLAPGVSVPDLPALPYELGSFSSILGPTSTRLAPVRINAVIEREGLPVFDGGFFFVFSSGDMPALLISGVRVSVIPLVYEAPFEERLEFPSAAAAPQSGVNEQVLSLTANPIQTFIVRFLLDGEDRQRMQVLLFGAQARVLALPLWHEEVTNTAAVSVAATTFATTDTTDVDLRVGGYALVYESATKFDVVLLSAVGVNSITFATTPLLYSYGAKGARVAPLRLGYIVNQPGGTRSLVKLEEFSTTFRVIDNDTGAQTGSTSGWSSYLGKVLLDDCNIADGSGTRETFTQRVTLIDNGTGTIALLPDWNTNQRVSEKRFIAHSRSEYKKLRRLLLALRGPQVSFYLPTFIEDLTPAASLLATGTTMDVVHIAYAKYNPDALESKATFRVTFTDGTSLFRKILSSVAVSDTVERLTIDTPWPTTRTVGEIVRIEFVEQVRFVGNSFTFKHQRTGLASLATTVKALLT